MVTKHTPGAFTNTDLETHLRARGIPQVVIVGVATRNGVEVSARQAYEIGFNVTLAIDATTGPTRTPMPTPTASPGPFRGSARPARPGKSSIR